MAVQFVIARAIQDGAYPVLSNINEPESSIIGIRKPDRKHYKRMVNLLTCKTPVPMPMGVMLHAIWPSVGAKNIKTKP